VAVGRTLGGDNAQLMTIFVFHRSCDHFTKQHLLDLIKENCIHAITLCETWLRSSDCLFIPGFDVIEWDRPGEHGGEVLLGFRKNLEFEKILSTKDL
jgi:hypothetical protein